MVCFIDFDGKTILSWAMCEDGIVLEDGRIIPEGHEDRIFSEHPIHNEHIEVIDGVYHYKGESLQNPLLMYRNWEVMRPPCGHIVCTYNYIDTGEPRCVHKTPGEE